MRNILFIQIFRFLFVNRMTMRPLQLIAATRQAFAVSISATQQMAATYQGLFGSNEINEDVDEEMDHGAEDEKNTNSTTHKLIQPIGELQTYFSL